MEVADIGIYGDFDRKEIAFSYKNVVRSATTAPNFRIVVYGNTESVSRTLRAKRPSTSTRPAHSAVANRTGHARRGMIPDNRKSPFLSNRIIVPVRVADLDIYGDFGRKEIAFS